MSIHNFSKITQQNLCDYAYYSVSVASNVFADITSHFSLKRQYVISEDVSPIIEVLLEA